MFRRFRTQIHGFPRQFWLMYWGMLMSATGASMIWPFLIIFASSRLDRPLAQVAGLMSVSSGMGVLAGLIAGQVTDRLGRKGVMVVNLFGAGLAYLSMQFASTWLQFAVLMALWGFFRPLYRVGSDAMVADLVPPERRPDAFALLRMASNVGVAIGPAVGGVLVSRSYALAFDLAATGLIGYSLLLALFAHETMPTREEAAMEPIWEGYGRVFRDGRFMSFAGTFLLAQVCVVLVWVLMGLYAKTQYGVPESQFGLIATTNAIMVVLFQFAVTRVSKRHPALRVTALGTLLYALGVGSVALARGFWGFWASMVVITLGEMLLVPTAATYAANLAPTDMRGRYMSVYGLVWGTASGIASPLGGWMSDTFGPRSIWLGGAVVGLMGSLGFLALSRRSSADAPLVDAPPLSR